MVIHKDTVNELMVWIDRNIHLPLVISAVATKAGYSKWHQQRLFKRETQQTLGEYIRKRRVILAASELASSHGSILDIALKYGFDSQQSFTRSFTKYFQEPPARWRREHYSPELY